MSLRSDVDEALRDARAAIEEAQRAFDRALDRQPFVPRSEAGVLRDEALQVQLRALDLQRHVTHLQVPAAEQPGPRASRPQAREFDERRAGRPRSQAGHRAVALCERAEPCAACGSDDLTHVEDAGTALVLCLWCGARREA